MHPSVRVLNFISNREVGLLLVINLFPRYLRASKWKVVTAINRIENTLSWRREYGLYDILDAKLVEPEVRY